MNILTIALFFICTWGLGYIVTSLIKNSENILERNLMRIGIGLGVFLVLGTIMNLLHIPLDWRIFLLLSVIFPIYSLIKDKGKILERLKGIKFTKSNIYILIALVLFFFTFYVYHTGAFNYPYLEDDDPWEHARSVKYISIEKTAYEPYKGMDLFRYIDPYPPGYEIMMAVLYQTNDSMNWTLKFFNALIISLGVLMFYFFVKEFTKSETKAIIAAFILTVIPSYLSHFIWVHSMIPILLFVAFYCLEMINHDKKWAWISGIIIGSIFVVSADESIKFVLFFAVYFIVQWIMLKKLPIEHIKSFLFGALLSLSWWATKTISMFSERAGRIANLDAGLVSADTNFIYKIFSFISNYFKPNLGSASRAYSFEDFFIAKSMNMINSPIGIGIVLSIMLIISLILVCIFMKKYISERKAYPLIILGWFMITFLMVNSVTFNIPGLFAFRTWFLLAIPIAILIAEGTVLMIRMSKSIKMPAWIILIIIITGAIFTSGVQKYAVNTAMWPPGASWTSMDEIQLYLWTANLPKDTKVFPFSGNQDNHLIGLDMSNCDWCQENIDLRKGFLNRSTEEVYNFLKRNKYEYVILDSMSFITYNEQLKNNTQKIIIEKFQDYAKESNKFAIVFQNKGGIILKVL